MLGCVRGKSLRLMRLDAKGGKLGEKFKFGNYELFVPEVRYWVAISVSNNPGKPFVLASLCMGLTGMIITTVGRMLRGRR